MERDKIPSLKVGTGWTNIEIISEPDVILNTYGGYKPVLKVFNTNTKLEFIMYITASSLSKQLEELRINNNYKFIGLKIKIRKESNDKTSAYEIINE